MTRAWIPLSLALLVPFAACKANLDQACEDGPCTGVTVAATVGAGGDTSFKCTYQDTFGFPCEVYTIIHENCHFCHINPPINNAPFPLLTYADTQAQYYNTQDKIWQHMKLAIEPGAVPGMPQGKNPPGLPEPLLDTLRAWFATCEAGTCQMGEGIGGAGGAGSESTNAATTSVATSSSSATTDSASSSTGN